MRGVLSHVGKLRGELAAQPSWAGNVQHVGLLSGLVAESGKLEGRAEHVGRLVGFHVVNTPPAAAFSGGGGSSVLSTSVISDGTTTVTIPPYSSILLVVWNATTQYPGLITLTFTNPAAGIFTMSDPPSEGAGTVIAVLYVPL